MAAVPRAVSLRRVDRAQAARDPPAQRAPDRAHDHRAAGPVHQGRSVDLDHDELLARGVPQASSRVSKMPCRRGRTPTSRRGSARSSARRPTSCSRASSAGRSHRRRSVRFTSRACTTAAKVAVKVQYPDIDEIVKPRSQHAAPDLPDRRVVHPVSGPRGSVSRDPRDRDGGARLPRRGRERRADRGELRGPHRCRVPARRRRSSRPRACSSRTSRPA